MLSLPEHISSRLYSSDETTFKKGYDTIPFDLLMSEHSSFDNPSDREVSCILNGISGQKRACRPGSVGTYQEFGSPSFKLLVRLRQTDRPRSLTSLGNMQAILMGLSILVFTKRIFERISACCNAQQKLLKAESSPGQQNSFLLSFSHLYLWIYFICSKHS